MPKRALERRCGNHCIAATHSQIWTADPTPNTKSKSRGVLTVIKMIITLKRREGMTHDEFTHYQRNIHRPLLMSIPETKRYVRRFVVSYPVPAPRYPEPDYDSVVEA